MQANLHLTNDGVAARALYQDIYQALLPAIAEERECASITQWLLTHYLGLTPLDKILDTSVSLTPEQNQLLATAIGRLNNHEPIQYVLGEAYFLGRVFKVNPAVLIPRPETEELVQDILRSTSNPNAKILDLGTGSGCIAISLQLALPQAEVWGLDIDRVALQTAQVNAQHLGATVQWLQADLLTEPLPQQRWHLIVSNPPYVRPSEQIEMHPRVLQYEPSLALFVPEEHPLIFHEKIVNLALRHLYAGGALYLELNEALGSEVVNLLQHAGFHNVRIQKDLHNKDRWVAGILA